MNIPVSRYSQNPLTILAVATLRRWYFTAEGPRSDIHRYAFACELERRSYPMDDWPIVDPFLHFTTAELRSYLPKLEDAGDRISAHAVRDEIQERGDQNRARGIQCPSGNFSRGYKFSFAPC